MMQTIRLSILFILACATSLAADWNTHQNDPYRSGVTDEGLTFPLKAAWIYQARHAPQHAWEDPNPQDFWHYAQNLKPRMTFDRAYHTVVAGGVVCFGSSSDDKVYALDATSGKEKWTFFADAPVRLSPTIQNQKVYFGADDGTVYCLDLSDGSLVWQYRAVENNRKIPGNGRLISPWAVRTGVLIADETAYFCSGLFPDEGVYLCALNANDGSEIYKQKINDSPQGHLLASSSRLYIPTGGGTPSIYNRADGSFIRSLEGHGGSYALLAGDEFTYGPGRNGQLDVFNNSDNAQLATFSGNQMIVTPKASYLLSDTDLTALDRARYLSLLNARQQLENKLRTASQQDAKHDGTQMKESEEVLRKIKIEIAENENQLKSCILWKVPSKQTYSLILAGNTLIAGGNGSVSTIDSSNGNIVWEETVSGIVYGTAVADGKLYVSTDSGAVYCFSKSESVDQTITIKPETAPPVESVHRPAVQEIINHADIAKGYCVVYNSGDGQSIHDLPMGNELQIIAIENDDRQVNRLRETLDRAGLYGTRVSVLKADPTDTGFTDYFANLIIAENEITDLTVIQEITRLLRPETGKAYLKIADNIKIETAVHHCTTLEWNGWTVLTRLPLEGAGEWTHQYADAGNTTNSNDRLVMGETQVQWFGKPGSRNAIDRHHRTVSPLAKDGVLYVPADNRITAVDAYNGTVLWQTGFPNSRRVGIPLDAGNLVLTDDYLYIAGERAVHGVNVINGGSDRVVLLPQDDPSSEHFWGYIASTGDYLIGSGQKPDASRTELSREIIVEQYGEFRPVVTSEYIFTINHKTGEHLWTYNDGVIINTAIAVGPEHVYFITCELDENGNQHDGKLPLRELLATPAYLVAIELKTGEIAWKEQVDLTDCQHVLYLSYANNTLLAAGSMNREETKSVWYSLYGFNAADGKQVWKQSLENNRKGLGGDHGEQVHHPVIIGDTVILEPRAFRLATGEPVNPSGGETDWFIPQRSGCGTMSGSAFCLFYRDSNPVIHQLQGGTKNKLSEVSRPGCWINIIAASGLVLVPEASSGCTCTYPIQTSMAFIPKNH